MYIYKLCRQDDDHYYIGSTQKTLKYRLKKHKDKSCERPDRKVYRHILNNGGWAEWQMEVLEHCPDLSLRELRMKENEYIKKDEFCLNCQYAIARLI